MIVLRRSRGAADQRWKKARLVMTAISHSSALATTAPMSADGNGQGGQQQNPFVGAEIGQ